MPCVAETVARLSGRVTQERGHEKSGDEHSRGEQHSTIYPLERVSTPKRVYMPKLVAEDHH